MKKEELTALGVTEEQATQILAINGKDIEHAKAVKDKEIKAASDERDDLKSRLETAETTLRGFDGIDPQKISAELEEYKQKAANAEKDYAAKLTQRDQSDWIKQKLDEYGVASPLARKQIAHECMSDDGLKWKDGAFQGFDDYMKAAKEQDKGLYQTEEEKKAAEEAAKAGEKAPKFAAPAGNDNNGGEATPFVPPALW